MITSLLNTILVLRHNYTELVESLDENQSEGAIVLPVLEKDKTVLGNQHYI